MTLTAVPTDYSERDRAIAINSYTTVLRRDHTPHEVFATYWRDVHGPLLAWYVQTHLHREQDAHLWPTIEGIRVFPDYVLDGGVEIGFASKRDQAIFLEACPLLFADEQNMFAATVAYALPKGSTSFVDRIAEPVPNGDDGLDRIHVHLGAAHDDAEAFGKFLINELAIPFAAEPAVLKLRLHLPDRYDNARPAPPAPNVGHAVTPERELIAVMELAFASPLQRRRFYESELFRSTLASQRKHIAYASPFAVSGVYTYVRDKQLTLAGLRGSRPAQLIELLGAQNQIEPEVRHLLMTGAIQAAK